MSANQSTAAIVAATLRKVSDLCQSDTDAAMLRDIAEQTDLDWDGISCPVCEEVTCDDNCPLAHARRESRGDQTPPTEGDQVT